MRVGPRLAGSGTAEGGLGLEQLAGQVRDAMTAPGGAIVYLEALEFISTEYQTEGMHALVNFLVTTVSASPSILVASVDPDSLAPTDRSRLGHSFGTVS
jgi:hypothetical protein